VHNANPPPFHFMTPPNKRNAPKAPKDEKLPWEKLYQACLHRAAYPQENEWDEQAQLEIKILEERFGEVLRTPPEPITLELLASTAVALLPVEGLDETNVVRRAYELLVLCGSELAIRKWAQEELAAINRRQKERRELGKINLKSKLTEAAQAITGRVSAEDAKHYFRAFLEVFYGEVAFEETRGQMLSRPPLMSFPTEEGKNKDWARDTYERYLERGLREDEVAYLKGKYKELTEGGFFDEKSTSRPLSRTKAKKRQTKG
jgi:hypothetical protein